LRVVISQFNILCKILDSKNLETISVSSLYNALFVVEGSTRPLGCHSYLHSDIKERFVVFQDSSGFNQTFASLFLCFVDDVNLSMRGKTRSLDGCSIGMSEAPIDFCTESEKITIFTSCISDLANESCDNVGTEFSIDRRRNTRKRKTNGNGNSGILNSDSSLLNSENSNIDTNSRRFSTSRREFKEFVLSYTTTDNETFRLKFNKRKDLLEFVKNFNKIVSIHQP